MRPGTRSAAGVTFALLAAAVSACGPGLESVHESNFRFEHCYRLDMDGRIAPSHREMCWRDWTAAYGSDLPLDHIEYARRRIAALESGDTRLVAIRSDVPTEGRVFEEIGPANAPMAAPAPTSAHEPPPRTEPVPAPPVAAPVAAEGAGAKPGEACASECETPLAACSKSCADKRGDCAPCREDYRRCMKRCFE